MKRIETAQILLLLCFFSTLSAQELGVDLAIQPTTTNNQWLVAYQPENASVTENYKEVNEKNSAFSETVQGFEATELSSDVQLDWTTNAPLGKDRFHIEHGYDGIQYTLIGMVYGSPKAIETEKYQFKHRNPTKGLNYYRIKRYLPDGRIDYSNSIRVYFVPDEELPKEKSPKATKVVHQTAKVSGTTVLDLALNKAAKRVQIYDLEESLIKDSKFLHDARIYIQINVADLPFGAYKADVMHTDGTIRTLWFVKTDEGFLEYR